jgi:hypothetical protein
MVFLVFGPILLISASAVTATVTVCGAKRYNGSDKGFFVTILTSIAVCLLVGGIYAAWSLVSLLYTLAA